MRGSLARAPAGLVELAPVVRGVVAGDVADADLGEQVVAALHLVHRPGQGVGRLLRVGDDLGEQVGQAVVLAELDPLGVDQDEPDLVGVARMSTDVMSELMHDDFPAPVAPAIRMCGIAARFTITGRPAMSRPRATSSGWVAAWASG